jgi:sugar phosphate isomerase/epimerase
MNPLCFNTMNRSAYILGDTDPDLPGQIRAAARAGFSLFGADSYSISRFCREGGRVEEIAAQLDSAGLESFELPTLAINRDRSTSRAQTDELVEMARVLRPAFVQLNLDSMVDDAVVEDLRRAGSAFGELGVRLAIEYLPWLPEVKDILSTRALLERAKIPGAGVLVDTWHFTHSGDRWEDLEALPLEELAYVQFDDHPPLLGEDLIHETLMRRAMPGEGEFELERFCRVFKEKGYEGPVSCEILSAQTRENDDLDAFAQRVFETSTPYWSD